VQYHRPGEA